MPLHPLQLLTPLALAAGLAFCPPGASAADDSLLPANADGLTQAARAHDWYAEPWSTLGTEPIPLISPEAVPQWQYGVTGPISAIHAFTGMAVSPQGIVFPGGGGHNAYGGNEVYAFSFADMTWSRPVDPQGQSGDKCKTVLSDGSAASVHSYDGAVYAPVNDTFYRFGGVAYCASLSESQDVFAVDATGWRHLGQAPKGVNVGISVKTAWNPVSRTILVAGRASGAEFDPMAERFVRTFGDWGFSTEGSAAYDPVHNNLLLMQTNGYWNLVDLASGRIVKSRSGQPSGGVGYSKRRALFVGWSGGRSVFTIDPRTLERTDYPIARGPAPGEGGSGGVFGKWDYLAEHDLFVGYDNASEGVWFFRLPQEPQPDPRKAALQAEGFNCADSLAGWPCAKIAPQLIRGEVRKGVYADGAIVTMARRVDFNGSRLIRAIQGKAALIARTDTTLADLTCIGIAVPAGNGACVRHEAGHLTLTDVVGRDSQSLVLSGPAAGPLTLERVTVENVGGDCRIKCGRAHGVYYAVPTGVLTIRDSRFARAKDQGHLVKTGARRTEIADTVLDERDGAGSRAIDAYNGGELVLRNVTIFANGYDGNPEIIGWNHEARNRHPVDRIVFDNVVVHCDGLARLIGVRPGGRPKVVGYETIRWPNGTC